MIAGLIRWAAAEVALAVETLKTSMRNPLGLPEYHQGSPVNYHHRETPQGRLQRERSQSLREAADRRMEERFKSPPQWVDSPLLEDGTYEECDECDHGFVKIDGELYLCESCGGHYYKAHGH